MGSLDSPNPMMAIAFRATSVVLAAMILHTVVK